MREGRSVNVPPKGDKRGRDEQGRDLLVPNDAAVHLREAFRLAVATGRSMESIRLDLRTAGFRCSRNQFTLLLRNPLYGGRIVIPSWGAEAEPDVAGVYEPLVEETDPSSAGPAGSSGRPDGPHRGPGARCDAPPRRRGRAARRA